MLFELPTFVLALGAVAPRLRADLSFGLSFFAFRVAYHVALCARWGGMARRDALQV